jgi:hypothetical protein
LALAALWASGCAAPEDGDGVQVIAPGDITQDTGPTASAGDFAPTYDVAKLLEVGPLRDPDQVEVLLKATGVSTTDLGVRRIGFAFRSQVWHSNAWDHLCVAYVPPNLSPDLEGVWAIVQEATADLEPGDPIDLEFAERTALEVGVPVIVLGQLPQPSSLAPELDPDLASDFPSCFGRQLALDELAECARELAWASGDLKWSLDLPMARAYLRAMTAAAELESELAEAGVTDVPLTKPTRFAILGAGDRGRAAWLSAALDDRVAGVWVGAFDEGRLDAYWTNVALVWGDPAAAEWLAFLETSFGWHWRTLTDVATYMERLGDRPATFVRGTNDPVYPLGSLLIYSASLPNNLETIYVPNRGHGYAYPEAVASWRALVRRAGGLAKRAEVALSTNSAGGAVALAAQPTGDIAVSSCVAHHALVPVGAGDRDFRQASWSSAPMTAPTTPGGPWTASLDVTGKTWAAVAACEGLDAAGSARSVTSAPRLSWMQQ